MTDLTPKQIEDALTKEEWTLYGLCRNESDTKSVSRDGIDFHIACVDTLTVLVSLAEARIENKRLKGAIESIPKMPVKYTDIESYQNFLMDGKGTYNDWLIKNEIDVVVLMKNFIGEYKSWRHKALLESEAKDEQL